MKTKAYPPVGKSNPKKHPLLLRKGLNDFRMPLYLQIRLKQEYGDQAARFLEACLFDATKWQPPDDNDLYEYDLEFQSKLEIMLGHAKTAITKTALKKQITEVKNRIEIYKGE